MKPPSTRQLVSATALAVGLTAPAVLLSAPAGAAGAHHTMAPVTETGRLSKIDSKSSFTLVVGKKTFIVKVDAMTHIKDGAKVVKFSALKVGDTVRVKGPDEMGDISATSVVIEM